MFVDFPSFIDIKETKEKKKTLYVLGASIDGPVLEPMRIKNIEQAKKVFGEGELIDACRQIVSFEDIELYLMRISGENATVRLIADVDGETHSVMQLRSIYGGEKYNNIEVYIEEEDVNGEKEYTLVIVTLDQFSPYQRYNLKDYKTLRELVYQINQDVQNKNSIVYAHTNFQDLSTSVLIEKNQTPKQLSGGETGYPLTKNERYRALGKAYELLEGREIDLICPYDAYFDDNIQPDFYNQSNYNEANYGANGDYLSIYNEEKQRYESFYEQAISFCQAQSQFGIFTHVVMGLKERQRSYGGYRYIPTLLNHPALQREGVSDYVYGELIDYGYYISVFAHDFVIDEKQKNGAVWYASVLASIVDKSSTNYPVSNMEPAFELENEEINDLANFGFVSLRRSPKYGWVVASGVTYGLFDSPMHYYMNIAMVQTTSRFLNQVLSRFVGEDFVNDMIFIEIDRDMSQALTYLFENKIIKEGYEYNVEYDAEKEAVVINLSLNPHYSIEKIKMKAYVNIL